MDKKDITFEFIEYEDSGTKEFFDRMLKLHGKPITATQCDFKDALAKLGITDLEVPHIKEMLNDLMIIAGLAKVQTSDGKITIEQTCE